MLHEASVKSGWPLVPLWSVARRVDRTGRPDAELLSVYRDHGVVRKSDRDDNWNQESEDLSTYKYVEPGDLVLNKMKTWQGSLAVSEYEGIVSPAYFTCTLAESVHPRFIHYLLRSTPYIALYGAASKGIRPGQWDLPFEAFRALPVLLPPLDVQRRVADFLDDQIGRIDSIISARGRQIADLTRSVESLAWGEVTAANQPGERKASGVA
ncbi:MAG: restriction endonuclease subunit S [Actinobacteria bacterium]|nr:MAG: restriction endonuclease subunit S [Actinomycetota bacterium]